MVQIIVDVPFIKPPGVNFLHAKCTHWLSDPKDQQKKRDKSIWKTNLNILCSSFLYFFQWHITVILLHWQLFYSGNSRLQNYLEDTISFYLSLSLALLILSCWISIWLLIYATWIIDWGWSNLKLNICHFTVKTFATLGWICGVCGEVVGVFFLFSFKHRNNFIADLYTALFLDFFKFRIFIIK